jgi:hypothetical protein
MDKVMSVRWEGTLLKAGDDVVVARIIESQEHTGFYLKVDGYPLRTLSKDGVNRTQLYGTSEAAREAAEIILHVRDAPIS